MYSAILALIIALMMIAFVIYKGSLYRGGYYVCKKSDLKYLTDTLPDDCIIHIWIGRNIYDEFRTGNSPRRNLRNHISE